MKNKSRILFLLIFVAIGVLFYISYQGFGNGHLLSYRNIDKGLDLSGGVYIVYEAQEESDTNSDYPEEDLENEELEIASESEDLEAALENEELEIALESEELEIASESEDLEIASESEDLEAALENEELEIASESEELEIALESEELEVASENEDLEAVLESEDLEEGLESEDLEITSEEVLEEGSDETSESEENQVERAGDSTWSEKMASAVSMIQQRMDRKGWTEANVYQEGSNRIRVEIPGIEDVETAVEEIGKTAKLSFTNIAGEVLVDGEDIINAYKSAYINQLGVQEIVVNVEFNEKGTQDFAKATEENLGSIIFIVLDDEIISYPTVNDVITDGNVMISGSFTSEYAEELASLIRAGSLPINLEILEMNTIGATLGANALKTSIVGGAIGLALILIFMLIFYKMNGFAADLALIIYILVELILLNFFNVTLTLHGIAGIILSIGMAVDANVIIFERIREELETGRNIKLAVEKGFSRALPAILDSNITTIIAGVVLYWLGTGAIKGFAQTLILGIVISMFTALFITRFILNVMINSGIKNPKFYKR